MSTIDTQNENIYASLGLSRDQGSNIPENDPSELGLNTFLKLMVTQLNNQDPMKPMENGEFLSQIAQFGAVSGLDKLNGQIGDLSTSLTSGQALQAASLVGREVMVPTDVGYLRAGEKINGRVNLTQPTSNLTLRVSNQAGVLVREMPLGDAQAGEKEFSWDGKEDAESYAPDGIYRLEVVGSVGGRELSLNTEVRAPVESVNLSGERGLTLNLRDLGPIAFSNVKEIYQ